MRFAILTGGFYPEPGGLSTFLHYFLPEAQAAGHDVALVTFGEPQPGDAARGYPVTRISRSAGFVRRVFRYARSARAIARDADTVFVVGFAVLLTPLLGRLPRRTVMKIVGDWSWEMARRRGLTTLDQVEFQTARHALPLRIMRAYYLWCVRRADRIITPSQHLARVIAGWGVPQERVRVIYNAVPESDLHTADRAGLRAKLGLPTDSRLLVSVARLTPIKGVHTAIEALAHLPADVVLVVVGEGPQLAELERMAPAGRVTFVGAQPHDRVLEYMRAGDVYVLSSVIEGLSHTLLEALSVGTPSVASNVGGNPEVVRDEVDGLLVPHSDPRALAAAIQRILDDPQLAERFAAAAYQRSLAFNWGDEVRQALDVLTTDG